MKTSARIVLTALLGLAIACDNRSDGDVKQQVEKAMNDYLSAIRSRDVEAVLGFWAEESRFISANNDLTGKAKLREMLTPLYDGLQISDLSSKTTRLEVDNNLAIQVIEYSETMTPKGGSEMTITGKQVTAWKRIGGEWKIVLVSIVPTSPDTVH